MSDAISRAGLSMWCLCLAMANYAASGGAGSVGMTEALALVRLYETPRDTAIITTGIGLVHFLTWDGDLLRCETSYPAQICRCGYYMLEWPADYPAPKE